MCSCSSSTTIRPRFSTGENTAERAPITLLTLPLLIPSLTINVTQAIIGGFRVFEQVLTLTDGGPGHQSTVVSMMVYEYFGRGFYGKSTAISMMLSVIVLFVTLAVRGYFNKKAVSY